MMRIRNKSRKLKNIGIRRRVRSVKIPGKGVIIMGVNMKNSIQDDIEFENADFSFMDEIRNTIQQTIKEKKLTEKQIRMSFGVKRYEK